MDKFKVAHDYAMKCVGNPNSALETINQIVAFAWAYADAMQAEADKRKEKGVPDAIKFEKLVINQD